MPTDNIKVDPLFAALSPKLALAFLETSVHPVYLLDSQGRFLFANKAACRMLGYDIAEFSNMTVHDIDPAFPQKRWPEHWRMIKRRRSFSLEATHQSKTGELYQVEVLVNYIEHSGQEYNLAIAKDISVLKRRENFLNEHREKLAQGVKEQASALWATQERYHQLLNGSLDAIFIHHPEDDSFPGAFFEVNQAACDLLQYTPEELTGMKPGQVIDPSDYEYARRAMWQLREHGSAFFELSLLSKSGRSIPVELNANLFKLENRPTIITVARDISERVQAENRRSEAEERYRALFELAGDAIFILAAEGEDAGRILDANQAAAEMHGYSREELLGMKIMQLDSAEAARKAPERIRSMMAGNWLKTEMMHHKKDGSQFPVEVSAGYITIGGKRIILAFDRDISQRHRDEQARRSLEAQLRQAQKIEAIGTLASGIAHDFNNVLGAISGYTELAKLAINKNETPSSHLDNVLTACARAKKLTSHILTFSRSTEQDYKPVKVKLVIEEVLNLMKASLPAVIALRVDLKSDGLCLGDPTQIHQIVMNLCTNAGQAMQQKGGLLEVILSETQIGHDNGLGLPPGDYLEIITADNGPGIDPSALDRIFDPFFSTKELGQGTGLGLSVVHGIVHNMGGGIKVESTLGAGATFRIYLPLLDKAAGADDQSVQDRIPTGTESILVVDDEPTLTEVSKQLLEFLGYKVAVTNSSLEALDIFTKNQEGIDLVITDQTMPKMPGTELIKRIKNLKPETPIIMLTGIHSKEQPPDLPLGKRCRIANKPITMEELARTVRELLDAS